MIYLRFVGIAFAIFILFYIWVFKSRSRSFRKYEKLFVSIFALTLIVLGIFPDTLNFVLELFSFSKGGGNRILGLLVLSNFFLYFLLFLSLSRNRNTEQVLDNLVRELAKNEFRKAGNKSNQGNAPVYVVIPAYNEAQNIANVLERIPDSVYGLATKTLVVVDGSTDETEQVVKGLNKPAISHTINRGGGSALKAGYQVALEDGAEIVVTLDADGQHLPEEIPDIVKPIIDGEADLVNGSRILGNYEKDNQIRSLGVLIFNWLITILMMKRITDASNAFRAIRMSEYPKLELRQRQFHSSELLIESLKKGLRVVEVPITIKKRMSGESKKGTTISYALGFTRAILLTWLR
ncbi:MAG: DUF2304 family protein [Candidatus Dadabacteria bacterium]|nr:DUF2304 family protein [Candidatus Dadabacteria bacterium]NIS08037.1 DUF2304 family protein [Candidatus Dadabacteria bacterium]NIV40860.1 DUF2304 family protein [Candidatus Dadabacteria bacterium]NIY21615.1 DUF2304 family protein [Candidatus Dadabacteria bacterium]